MSIVFSVVIATCNRPDRLPATLQAVGRAIEADGGAHDLVVVDNGSTRPAQEAVESFARTAPFAVRCLASEPRARSRAMNAGVRAATADWIAFTDDDTLPGPNWLKAAAAFAGRGDCRIFGGRIDPGAPVRPLPAWLRPGRSGRVGGHVVFVRYAPQAHSGVLAPDAPVPFGANFFVRKDLFDRYGGFDEQLWALCGRAALGGDDTEFELRVRRAGEPIGYCHEAAMVHPVHHERCNLRDQFRLAYDYGWRDPMVFFDAARRRVEPYELRLMGRFLAGALRDLALRDPAGSVDHALKLARAWGSLRCRCSRAYREWSAIQSNGAERVDGCAPAARRARDAAEKGC